MKRSYLVSLAVQALLLAMPAVGNAQAIGKAMGNLRWGMSDTDVVRVTKTRMADQYAEKIKKAKGSAKASLERELASKQKAINGKVVEFTGKSSRWDKTPIAGEYGYGTGESMLAIDDGESENYYFFLDGRLWKWVKLYPTSQFGGKSFGKFSSAIQKKFGKGYKKETELNGSSQKYTFLEYLDRNSRLRAIDRSSDANKYSLVFEEMATVRQIAQLRPTQKKAPARLATADDDEDEVAAKPQKADKHRSVFGNDDADESQDNYEARKAEMIAKKREQQRKAYEREQEMKKGKALDSLQGVDDDDPLAGMN